MPSRALRLAGPVLACLATALACRAQPPRELTVLLPYEIATIDPNDQLYSVNAAVLANVYEPLVGFDEELRTRLVLAESYEHPEPERWRFHLRPGLRFHDGSPVDAPAVRDAFALLRTSQQEAYAFLAHVVDVVAVSSLTLDIVTDEPRALLANLPFVYVTRPSAPGRPPQGTGPYRVREWERGRHVALESVPGWRGGVPRIAAARFEHHPDGAVRAARAFSGAVDIASWIPAARAAEAPATVRMARRRGITVAYLGFDLRPATGNPFADLRVRRAFHLGVDREDLVRTGLGGAGTVATQPVAPLIFGFDPGIEAPARDLAAARRLLAEAGYAQGIRARLDYAITRDPIARLLAAQLALLGIDLELAALTVRGVYDRAEAGESRLYLVGWDCTSGEATEFFEFCLHTRADGYGLANYGHYSNPELDRLAEGSGAILDQRLRQDALQRAARIVMADLPVVPLYVEDDVYAVRRGIRFQPRADGEFRLIDIERER